jgi:fructokinase
VIVVVGEALVDLAVAADGAIGAHLGGGPYNTARTLGRLGVPVRWMGRLSDDVFGRKLRAALAEDGVDLGSAVSTADPTTMALAELDEAGKATYRFYIDGTSVPGLDAGTALSVLPAQLDALHIGTLALVLQPLASAVEAVLASTEGRCLVMCDPNVRPAVIRDAESFHDVLFRVLERTHVLKVSDDDLAWLQPGVDPVEAGRSLLENGPSTVFVTRGGEGIHVLTHEGEQHVPAPEVVVADTIGAGDSFSGGVLTWWAEHGRPSLAALPNAVAAASFGAAVAAITVSRAGATPPYRSELPA